VKGPQRRRRPAWCSWHDGLSDTAVLVQVRDDSATGPNGGLLYACDRCRQAHALTPLTDQP
jgi:hypothetical protein